ncbi:MAG: TetR/AcrR family transcriptional regulator [Kordiimonadaceae bacterium]|nr:TetR/AcrR family transcriptional regulator [Kordiimonadaceae bacterium]
MAKQKTANAVEKGEKKGSKRKLIVAAAQLFKTSGYDKTTVRDIANAVGITSGSIFYYFDSKEDLLEAVILYGISAGLEIIVAELEKKSTPTSRFHALVYAHLLALHGEPGNAHEVSSREWSRLPNDARARLKGLHERYRVIWTQELNALKDAEVLVGDEEMCRRIMVPALNWSSTWLNSKTKKVFEDIADNMCAGVLNISKQEFHSMRKAA